MSIAHKLSKMTWIMCICCTLLIARERDTLKVYPFDPVVVTGTRLEIPKREIPLSISIVSQRTVQEQKHVPLLDLVSESVPGLFVTQRSNIGYGVASGSAGQISIRGMGSFPNTQVLVLIDGRPDIMGLFGHPLGDAYFLHDVDRIEVVRGPASLLYGSNAMGGAINIITNHRHEPGFHVQLPLRFGSWGTKQGYIRNTYQSDHWGYLLSAGYRDSDGFREDAEDSYLSRSANLEAHLDLSQSLRILINSYFSDLDLNDPGRLQDAYQDNWYDIQRYGGDISAVYQSGIWRTDLKLHTNYGIHAVYDGYESKDYTTGITLNQTVQVSPTTRFLAGVDWRSYGGKALIKGVWNDQTVNEQSLLASLHQQLFGWIILDGGLRYSRHTVAGEYWTPAAGLLARLPYDIRIRLNYAHGYRYPTINELYLFMPSTTELEAEVSRNLELSLEKQFAQLLTSTLTVYRTQAENLIQKTGPPPLYQNTGEVEIIGVEWEGQLYLPPHVSLQWGLSTQRHSRTIAASPGEKLDLSLRYQFTPALNTTLQLQWINNLYSVEDPYAYTPPVYRKLEPYVLLHLRGNLNLHKNLDLYAAVENLLDTDYQTMYGFPMPGRSFTVGITAAY